MDQSRIITNLDKIKALTDWCSGHVGIPDAALVYGAVGAEMALRRDLCTGPDPVERRPVTCRHCGAASKRNCSDASCPLPRDTRARFVPSRSASQARTDA